MNRNDIIKLFGETIIQDSYDCTNNIALYKSVFDSTFNLKYNYNLSTCTSLLKTDKNTNETYTHIIDDISHDHMYISEINDHDWTSGFTEEDFYFHYHIKKSTFSLFLKVIQENYLISIYETMNFSLPFGKSLLITLWYLAKGVSFDDITDNCNLVPSHILPLINSILTIFTNMKAKYILWPNKDQIYNNSDLFLENYGYPNVLGALGHMHINFKPSLNDDELYRNKNMGYSLVLQAICNSNKEFIDIFPECPGSMDAATVLKHSILYKKIEETSTSYYFNNKYHLAACDKYPLRSWIMTPYRNHEMVDPQHEKHNNALLSCVSTIDDAFAVLLSRWRILRLVNSNSSNYVQKIITACCILHNFCIQHEDLFDDVIKDGSSMRDSHYCDYSEEGVRKRNKHLISFPNVIDTE